MGATTTMYISNPREGHMSSKTTKSGTGKTTKKKKGKKHHKRNPEGLMAAAKAVGVTVGSVALLAGAGFASTKISSKPGKVALLAGLALASAAGFAFFGQPGAAVVTGTSLGFGAASAAVTPTPDAARLAAAASVPQVNGAINPNAPRPARVQGAIRING